MGEESGRGGFPGGGVTQREFEQALREFVSGLARRKRPIRRNTLLFETGLIDSIRILDLIAFIEVTIGASIPDHAIRLENFRSIAAIGGAFAISEEHGVPS
jgi:acyl carrier protein